MPTKCSDTAETTVHFRLSTIKQELRGMMNGVASAAMRHTEDYRVNFGVELPRLQQLAHTYEPDHQLAQTLWKESVRECRILATILQPVTSFPTELADVWVEQIHTAEIAQIASLNLFQRLPYASEKAFQWIASDREIAQICGLATIFHVARRYELQPRAAVELRDQAESLRQSNQIALQRLANNIISFLDEQRETK